MSASVIVKRNRFLGALVAAAGLLLAGGSPAASATTYTRTLTNGLRIAVIHFPGSTNVSLFTFLPLGLTADGPGQTQWSHLVEHLVIRSTAPAEAAWANAETLPDHMRLDFYGNTTNWREGLSHQTRWLKGETFTGSILEAEKPKVMQECDFTVRNLATHKFALAAWNQAVRHDRSHAGVRTDVLGAVLADVQRHRDRHLFIPEQTTVCLVGGIAPEEALRVLAEELGTLTSNATPPGQRELKPGSHDVTWDLDARHLVKTWRIPGPAHEDHAALMVAGQLLRMRFFADDELKRLAGMTFAGTELATPEGAWFYVSASGRADTDLQQLEARIDSHLKALSEDRSALAQVPMLGQQLAFNLTQVADPKMVRAHAPASMTDAIIEGNLGLQWAMQAHRYGPDRESLAARLRSVTADQVRTAVIGRLGADKAVLCRIRPGVAAPP